MATRPKVTGVEYRADDDVWNVTFDQNITHSGPGVGLPGEVTDPDETVLNTLQVEGFADNTLQLSASNEIDHHNLTSGPGRITCTQDIGVTGVDGGLPAYPFAERLAAPHVRSVEITGGGTGAIIHWSEPLSRVGAATTDIQYKTEAGQGKKLNAITAGDTTDTWTITLQNTTNANPPGLFTVVYHAGQNAATTPNIEFPDPAT